MNNNHNKLPKLLKLLPSKRRGKWNFSSKIKIKKSKLSTYTFDINNPSTVNPAKTMKDITLTQMKEIPIKENIPKYHELNKTNSRWGVLS